MDWEKLLEIAPLLIAAQNNPARAAALHGWMQSQGQIQQGRMQQQKQQQEDAARRAQLENQAFQQQSQAENQQRQNERADAQLALNRLTAYRHENQGMLDALGKAPEQYLTPESDPLQEQNALTVERLKAQQQYGVPAGTPQGPLPNMTAMVSEAKKRRARKRYTEIEKRLGPEAAANNSIKETAGEFAGMSPADILALFESPLVDAQGQRATPSVKPSAPSAGFTLSPGATRFDASGQPIASLPPKPEKPPAGEAKPQWILRNGKPVHTADIQPGDQPYAAPRSTSETAQDRLRNARVQAARGFLDKLNSLREKINTKMGPAAGATGLYRRGRASIGMDPDVAEYERERAAGGRSLAVAIMGAQNLSDADAKAWADMLPGATVDRETARRLMEQVESMLQGLNSVSDRGAPPVSGGRFEILGVK